MEITIYNNNNYKSSSHLRRPCHVPITVFCGNMSSEPSEGPSEVSIIIPALNLRVQAQGGTVTCHTMSQGHGPAWSCLDVS